jgi:hypothetical protein
MIVDVAMNTHKIEAPKVLYPKMKSKLFNLYKRILIRTMQIITATCLQAEFVV